MWSCSVLGLAGVELTFFIAALMLLYDLWPQWCWEHTSVFSNSWTVPTQQRGCLCFSLCPCSEGAGRGSRGLGEDTASTADPNCLGGCSILCKFMLSNKTGGHLSKVAIAWRLSGHRSGSGMWWIPFHHLLGVFCVVFLIYFFFPFTKGVEFPCWTPACPNANTWLAGYTAWNLSAGIFISCNDCVKITASPVLNAVNR